MAIALNCKMCGGKLDISGITGNKTVCECEYCGTLQTIPTLDDDKKLEKIRIAQNSFRNHEFDKAELLFEDIIAEFPEESEAYWGVCLCRYGIEYVEDPTSLRRIPTCHRTSFTSILDDEYYSLAMDYATVESQKKLMDEANEIDKLQKDILKVVNAEEPYDIFISYKETDEIGLRTRDSELAQQIYEELTDEKHGYRVFFSKISLQEKLGREYEPYIFSALNSAKLFILVCTDPKYAEAVWVKNEWARFLKIKEKDREKQMVICYKDMKPESLPQEIRLLQAQDMSQIGAFQDFMYGVNKIIPVKKSEPKVVVASNGPTIDSMLMRASICIEQGSWEKADSLIDNVLNIDPENPKAYYMQYLVQNKYSNADNGKLPVTFDFVSNDTNYRLAERYSVRSAEEKKWFQSECDNLYDAVSKKILKQANNLPMSDAIKMILPNVSALSKMNDTAKAKQIEARLMDYIYDYCCRTSKSDDPEIVTQAADYFSQISDYKDSKERSEECRRTAEEQRQKANDEMLENLYTKALLADKDGDFKTAKDTYTELLSHCDYKDARDLLAKCREREEKHLAEEEKLMIEDYYKRALQCYEKKDYVAARDYFEKTKGYKDTYQYLPICRKKAYKITKKQAPKGSGYKSSSSSRRSSYIDTRRVVGNTFAWIIFAASAFIALLGGPVLGMGTPENLLPAIIVAAVAFIVGFCNDNVVIVFAAPIEAVAAIIYVWATEGLEEALALIITTIICGVAIKIFLSVTDNI